MNWRDWLSVGFVALTAPFVFHSADEALEGYGVGYHSAVRLAGLVAIAAMAFRRTHSPLSGMTPRSGTEMAAGPHPWIGNSNRARRCEDFGRRQGDLGATIALRWQRHALSTRLQDFSKLEKPPAEYHIRQMVRTIWARIFAASLFHFS
jgi:hypothetical protein